MKIKKTSVFILCLILCLTVPLLQATGTTLHSNHITALIKSLDQRISNLEKNAHTMQTTFDNTNNNIALASNLLKVIALGAVTVGTIAALGWIIHYMITENKKSGKETKVEQNQISPAPEILT